MLTLCLQTVLYNIKALKRVTSAELHFYSVVDELYGAQH